MSMPAPSPVSSSQPHAPRWLRRVRITAASRTVSCEGLPLSSAMKPTPHASFSFSGLYRPCFCGQASKCVVGAAPDILWDAVGCASVPCPSRACVSSGSGTYRNVLGGLSRGRIIISPVASPGSSRVHMRKEPLRPAKHRTFLSQEILELETPARKEPKIQLSSEVRIDRVEFRFSKNLRGRIDG